MVGMDVKFWKESGVWDLFEYSARGTSYSKYIKLSDDNEEVIQLLLDHAQERGFPLNPLTL
jgi:hypothetical protein